MWNSITGMIDSILTTRKEVASDATAVIYGFFAASSVFSPAVNNLLGAPRTLFVGTLGYLSYIGSLLYFRSYPTDFGQFVVLFAAALNGISASLLWTAQGQLCMAYPTEVNKGLYLGVFWVIFNFGGVVGGVVSLISNLDSSGSTQSITTIYIFCAVMGVGTCISFFLASPSKVSRIDGSEIVIEKSDWKSEARKIVGLATDPTMIALLPLFAYSNFFYAYQFGPYQSIFNARTQGFNNIFYWGAQMLGAYIIGKYLDIPTLSPRTKGIVSFWAFGLYTAAVWGFTTWANIGRKIDDIQAGPPRSEGINPLDFDKAAEFFPLFFLYFCCGAADAFVQNWSYWLMANLTTDVSKLGQYAGFYKGIQAAGGAISWKINGSGVSGTAQIVINVALFVICFVPALRIAGRLSDKPLEEEGGLSAKLAQEEDEGYDERPESEGSVGSERSNSKPIEAI
jgi:hypothetical protein